MNKWIRFIFVGLLPVLIVAAALAYTVWSIRNRKEPPKQPAEIPVLRVAVVPAELAPASVIVEAYGVVRPFWESELSAEVSGAIVSVSPAFREGNALKKGEVILQIDRRDFEAALAEQQSNVSLAEKDLVEEIAQGAQAVRDWQRMNKKPEEASPLTRREPQREAAEARLEAAQALLARAQTDLERTVIRAPYDCIVAERLTNPGEVVQVGRVLGRVFASDRSEVRLSLSQSEASSLQLSSEVLPLQVELTSDSMPGGRWGAQITRIESILDAQSRVVFAIAEIETPFANKKYPLRLQTFVKVQIQGKGTELLYALPESVLVDDQYIWTLDAESKLQQISVKRRFAYEGQVYLKTEAEVAGLPVLVRPLSTLREGVTAESYLDNEGVGL